MRQAIASRGQHPYVYLSPGFGKSLPATPQLLAPFTFLPPARTTDGTLQTALPPSFAAFNTGLQATRPTPVGQPGQAPPHMITIVEPGSVHAPTSDEAYKPSKF